MRDKCLRDYTGKNDKTKVATLTIFCSNPCNRVDNFRNDCYILLKSGYSQTDISKTKAC
jgi:hypothetical protein